MNSKLAQLAALAVAISLSSPLAMAQEDETYDFDGVADMDPQPADPTDWMTSENWSDGGSDPFGPPFGPLLPDLGTRVEIETSTFGVDAPVIGPGDTAEAFGVRIARFGGDGLLTMNGGTLDIADTCLAPFFNCNRRLRVGAADVVLPEDRHPGAFNLSAGTVTTDTLWIGSGSQGTMNMSGGVVNTRGHFYFDWTFDASSVLNMTGGTINIGTVLNFPLRMYRNSSLNLDGGEIFVSGPAELGTETGAPPASIQTPAVIVSITDGLLESGSFLQIGGSVVIDGGILRADSFNEALSAGTVDINGPGLLQFNNAQESVAAVNGLITGGFFTTSDAAGLSVDIVDVSGTDFTQVSVASAGIPGDFDGDGDIDGKDFLEIQRNNAAGIPVWESNYGTVPLLSAAQAVPEPGSLVLAALAGVALVCRSRNFCH